jgi:hypothetical protein
MLQAMGQRVQPIGIPERIVSQTLDETGTHGVQDNIAGAIDEFFVRTQGMVVEAIGPDAADAGVLTP